MDGSNGRRLTIRPATPADIPALRRLLDEQNAFHVDLQPSTFVLHPTDEARIRKTFDDPNAEFLVAEEGGGIVGLIELAIGQTKDIPILVAKTYAGIGDVIVDERHRGQGIGSALMEEARTWARKHGAASLRTAVVPTNDRARAFYAKQGFVDTMIRIEAEL